MYVCLYFCHDYVLRRGSPLLIGVKSGRKSQSDIIPVTFSEFGKGTSNLLVVIENTIIQSFVAGRCLYEKPPKPVLTPSADETGVSFDRQLQDMSMEYFFASDAR